jgi:hypothetical protein
MNALFHIPVVIFVAGLLCGVFLPHAPVYAKIANHFYKCLTKRDRAIRRLRIENQFLKQRLNKES